MGLFSGILGKGTDDTIDASTAVMIPMVAATAADGDIDDDEVRQIRSICACSPIYARNSMETDTQIIKRAVRIVGDLGIVPACAKAAEVLSLPLRETAFSFAAQIVFADGHVGTAEQQMLERLVSTFELQEGRARAIVDVVGVMQRSLSA